MSKKAKFANKKLRKGDTVRVTEKESPWIRGTWYGRVIQAFENTNDAYVKPIDKQPDFRIRPSQEYLEHGLYLTKDDEKVITHRNTKIGRKTAKQSAGKTRD